MPRRGLVCDFVICKEELRIYNFLLAQSDFVLSTLSERVDKQHAFVEAQLHRQGLDLRRHGSIMPGLFTPGLRSRYFVICPD
jgi:hypothetical protein